MGGQLVNDTLDALVQGVTQQFQEGRFTSQVSEMINCIPSVSRGVIRRNPIRAVNTLSAPLLPTDLSNAFVYAYDRGTDIEQYIIVIPGDGSIHVFRADGTYLYSKTNQPYLEVSPLVRARDVFEALTIGDHTFIVNKTKVVDFDKSITAPSAGYSDYAFYWIKKTTSIVTHQKQETSGEAGSRVEGYTYTINDYEIQGVADTRPGETEVDLNTSYKIAEEIAKNSDTSFLDKSEDSFAYNLSYQDVATDLKWSDSFADEASLGVWKKVNDSSELPSRLPDALDGFIVNVTSSTANDVDDYYLQYSAEEKTWKEVPYPGSYIAIDPETMPHVLYRLAGGKWEFDTYQGVTSDGSYLDGESKWAHRKTRGQEDIDNPSFIGRALEDIFFHKNRLGFISEESVILSSTNDFGNFFVQTALEVLDDDPIDLSVSSTDVTILRKAVSLSGQLILFADEAQFSLISLQGVLTPRTADIVHLSSYTYDDLPGAAPIGNKVYFISSTHNTSHVFAYQIKDDTTIQSEANQLTLHLPDYIKAPVNTIVGHDVLGFIFFKSEAEPNILYVLNTVSKQGQDLQNAFHKWEFEKEIASIHIIDKELFILFASRELVRMSLDTPDNITNVEYLDDYSQQESRIPYTSKIIFSKFFVKDNSGLGTVRGRYQIRTIQYTINPLSKYKTTIYSLDKVQFRHPSFFGPMWKDEDNWDDTKYWVDEESFYTREYVNDNKVTVMGNNDNLLITFENDIDEPDKGFELVTVNVEGFFYQRSQRI